MGLYTECFSSEVEDFAEQFSTMLDSTAELSNEHQKVVLIHFDSSLKILPRLVSSMSDLASLTPERLNYYLSNYGKFLRLSRDHSDHIRILKMESQAFHLLFHPNYTYKSPSGISNSPNPFLTQALSRGAFTPADLASKTFEELSAYCH